MRYDVDAKLYTNNPKVETPQWIDDISFKQPVQRQLDVGFNEDIINRKHVLAERSMYDLGNIRDLKLTFDDKQLKTYAVNQLTKEFRKYRFNVIKASAENGVATVEAMFDKCPLTYQFTFTEKDGKVVSNPFFRTSLANIVNEYSYNVAGLEDSFADAKTINVKEPTKVKASKYTYNVITRYDIVQRCNNKLSVARDLIAKHTKDNSIVAVGSNEYASTYDINYLFPDMREKFAGEQSHMHDFVKNRVNTASYENKSANRLALEANNIINNTFDVYKLITASRDNDKLFVTAELVNNNVRGIYNFDFNIKNESVDKLNYIENENYERFTVHQLLEQFGTLNKRVAQYLGTTDKVASGYVYSAKTIKAQLKHCMTDDTISNMLQNWTSTKLATKLNSTTYASPHSLQELVYLTNTELMSDEDIKAVRLAQQTFGDGSRFYFHDNQENDTRNKVAIAKVEKLNCQIDKYIGHYFKNYNFKYLGNHQLTINFDDKKVTACIKNKHIVCDVNGKEVALKDLAKQFTQNKLLKAYIKDKNIKVDNDLSKKKQIVINANQIRNKLNDYLSNDDINNLINDLIQTKKLQKVASNQFVASDSFENLIRDCAYEVDDDIKSLNLQKANRLDYLKTLKAFLMDNDTRTNVAIANQQKRIANLYKRIDNYLQDYTLKMIDGNNFVISFKGKDNKKRNVIATLNKNNIFCQIGNTMLDIKDLAMRFKDSKILQAYLKDNKVDNHNRKIILSKKMFNEKMQDYLAKEDINNIFQNLIDNHLLTAIANDKYASEYSFEDLLRRCDIDVNKEIKEYNLAVKNRLKDKEIVADYDLDGDTRYAEHQFNETDFKVQYEQTLPDYIECTDIKDVDINENIATAQCSLFNKKTGLKTSVTVTASIKDGQLQANYSDDIFQQNTLVDTYNKFNNGIKNGNKMIISKADIVSKLYKIASVENIDDVIHQLEQNHYITDIGNKHYASNVSFEQLLSLANINSFDAETISKNYRKANASTEFIPKEYHVADVDSKDLTMVEDGKTKDEFEHSKKACMAKLDTLFNNKKITSSRRDSIAETINNCDNDIDLNKCYNQILRYER